MQRTNLLQLETRPQTVCGVPPDGRPRARGWGLVSLAPQLRWHSWHCAYWLGPWRGGQPHCPATGANEKESPRRFQMPLQLWKHAAHSPTICAYPTRHWAMARANSFVYSHSVARSMGQTIGQSSQGGKPRQGIVSVFPVSTHVATRGFRLRDVWCGCGVRTAKTRAIRSVRRSGVVVPVPAGAACAASAGMGGQGKDRVKQCSRSGVYTCD